MIKYRKAGIEDVESLAVLFDMYRVFYRKESDIVGARAFLSERISNSDSILYVAEYSENKLVGFVQLYPLFSSTRMKRLWLLNDLFVHSDFRNQGVSIGLIDQAKALVLETNACGMFLETERTNVVGNNLYPKTGFSLNEASNYYEWSPE